MTSVSARRVVEDVQELAREIPDGTRFGVPDENSLSEFTAVIRGFEGSVYETGQFHLSITLPRPENRRDLEYPDVPPKVAFTTPVYHPNVYKDGKICWELLEGKGWNSSIGFKGLLFHLQTFLENPNAESPANQEAARLWQTYEKVKRLRMEDRLGEATHEERREARQFKRKVLECCSDSWISNLSRDPRFNRAERIFGEMTDDGNTGESGCGDGALTGSGASLPGPPPLKIHKL
ncbi:unnamed protein product [Vitrella brassicaformis CCMP3155]|uniref:UBC core domain-containing protein n=2 Tax=Vitrella brassicaformis TaxID=1169539 RepID=A0A0G4GB29_VITBC|nr:unnamed protein product [Vitrella brassicaformis CCMP3155]|eukprot:CEM26333.1 unnamed protein product [Vitrella brassicaformis CCMP3155]